MWSYLGAVNLCILHLSQKVLNLGQPELAHKLEWSKVDVFTNDMYRTQSSSHEHIWKSSRLELISYMQSLSFVDEVYVPQQSLFLEPGLVHDVQVIVMWCERGFDSI